MTTPNKIKIVDAAALPHGKLSAKTNHPAAKAVRSLKIGQGFAVPVADIEEAIRLRAMFHQIAHRSGKKISTWRADNHLCIERIK